MRTSLRRGKVPEKLDVGELLRLQPAFKFGIEVFCASWVSTSFLSWILLNAYLKAVGQRGVPLDLAGTWVVLILMGAVLTVSLSVIALVFIAAEETMRFLHRGKAVRRVTKIAFATSVCMSVGGLLAIQEILSWTVGGFAIALSFGYATGLAVGWRHWFLDTGAKGDGARFAGVLAAWTGFAVLLVLLVAAEFSIVLRLQLSETTSFRLAVLISIIQLTICTMLPRGWAVGATIVGAAWLITTVSPGLYAIVLVGLDSTNQGGGLPSGPLTSKEAATTCNLGTPQRPVIYRERAGCSRKAALEKLKIIVAADTPLDKAGIIAGWRDATGS